MTIFRGHINDNDFIVYWKGRVSGSKAGGHSVSLNCESIFTSLRRPGLRARYQRTCRHALYSSNCGVNLETHGREMRLLHIASTNCNIPDASEFIDGYFTGGMIKAPDNSLRLISNHTGASITLSRPIISLETGFVNSGYGGVRVILYPGCDRLKSTCIDKFNNVENHGGFPFIPIKNPFGGSSIV